MQDVVNVPTLVKWLRELTATKSPTRFQLVEAWQVAQTIHGIRFPADQEKLDNVRRDIIRYLANTENRFNKELDDFNPHVHAIVPSRRRLTAWTEVELTPELSWSTVLAGRTVPNKLVKRLRAALGKQHANINQLLSRRRDGEDD